MLPRITLLCTLLMWLPASTTAGNELTHDDLMKLFRDWREFESPPLLDGAPDYTPASIAGLTEGLLTFRARLAAFDIDDWPIPHQVDWHLVRAEMNGLEFNIRVLKPWTRDPAYYRQVWTYDSDTPAHEGPINHTTRAVDLRKTEHREDAYTVRACVTTL